MEEYQPNVECLEKSPRYTDLQECETLVSSMPVSQDMQIFGREGDPNVDVQLPWKTPKRKFYISIPVPLHVMLVVLVPIKIDSRWQTVESFLQSQNLKKKFSQIFLDQEHLARSGCTWVRYPFLEIRSADQILLVTGECELYITANIMPVRTNWYGLWQAASAVLGKCGSKLEQGIAFVGKFTFSI